MGVLLALLLTVSAFAQSAATEEAAIRETAQAWLEAYTAKVYLYETSNLSELTVAELPTVQRAGLNFNRSLYTTDTRAVDTTAMSRTTDSIAYLLDKAEYFSQMRQMQGITREEFEATYRFGDVTISGNSAYVSVTETKGFRYSDVTFKTYIAEVFDVYLVKVGNEWLVYDVCSDDGFDVQFKTSGFQIAEALAELRVACANTTPGEPIFKMEAGTPVSTHAAVTSTNRLYNRTNAVNYALTYTPSGSAATRLYHQYSICWLVNK